MASCAGRGADCANATDAPVRTSPTVMPILQIDLLRDKSLSCLRPTKARNRESYVSLETSRHIASSTLIGLSLYVTRSASAKFRQQSLQLRLFFICFCIYQCILSANR